MQVEIAQRVAKQGWSVRETEAAVRRLAGSPGAAPKPAKTGGRPADPNVKRLETELAETLGAVVAIEHGPKGGRVDHSLQRTRGARGHSRAHQVTARRDLLPCPSARRVGRPQRAVE